jgi:hypothetical protein
MNKVQLAGFATTFLSTLAGGLFVLVLMHVIH